MTIFSILLAIERKELILLLWSKYYQNQKAFGISEEIRLNITLLESNNW